MSESETHPIPPPPPAVVQLFQPNSFDSQFAGLHTTLRMQTDYFALRIDRLDRNIEAVKTQTTTTNGRVTMLEGKWKTATGWALGAAATVTAAIQLAIHFWK